VYKLMLEVISLGGPLLTFILNSITFYCFSTQFDVLSIGIPMQANLRIKKERDKQEN
jgi:hypothetical protein